MRANKDSLQANYVKNTLWLSKQCKIKVVLFHAIKAMEVQLHLFLTSVRDVRDLVNIQIHIFIKNVSQLFTVKCSRTTGYR